MGNKLSVLRDGKTLPTTHTISLSTFHGENYAIENLYYLIRSC